MRWISCPPGNRTKIHNTPIIITDATFFVRLRPNALAGRAFFQHVRMQHEVRVPSNIATRLHFLGEFAYSLIREKRLLPSSCPSVCPHVTARLPPAEFPWNLTLWTFTKIQRKIYKILVKNGQEYRSLYVKTSESFIVASNTKSLQNGSLRVTEYQAVRITEEAQTLGERVSCLWFI